MEAAAPSAFSDGGGNEGSAFEGPPAWRWPEAAEWILHEPLGLHPSTLPCGTHAATSIPRSLRFLLKHVGLLLSAGGGSAVQDTHLRTRSAATEEAWQHGGAPREKERIVSAAPPLELPPKLRAALRNAAIWLRDADSGLWTRLKAIQEDPSNAHLLTAFLADVTTRWVARMQGNKAPPPRSVGSSQSRSQWVVCGNLGVCRLKALAAGEAALIPGGALLDQESPACYFMFVVYRHPDGTREASRLSGLDSVEGAASGGGSYLEEGVHGPARRRYSVALVNPSGHGAEFHSIAVEKCVCPGEPLVFVSPPKRFSCGLCWRR